MKAAVPDLIDSSSRLFWGIAIGVGRDAEDGSSFDAFLVVLVEAVASSLKFATHATFSRQIGGADFAAGLVSQIVPVHLESAVVECVDELVRQSLFEVAFVVKLVLAD